MVSSCLRSVRSWFLMALLSALYSDSSDDSFWTCTSTLTEGGKVVTSGYIHRWAVLSNQSFSTRGSPTHFPETIWSP
jgi:hypothetical protein